MKRKLKSGKQGCRESERDKLSQEKDTVTDQQRVRDLDWSCPRTGIRATWRKRKMMMKGGRKERRERVCDTEKEGMRGFLEESPVFQHSATVIRVPRPFSPDLTHTQPTPRLHNNPPPKVCQVLMPILLTLQDSTQRQPCTPHPLHNTQSMNHFVSYYSNNSRTNCLVLPEQGRPSLPSRSI